MVHQVCEAGRGLVRQQVGEEIPGASHREGERERETEHDLSDTGAKTNRVNKAVKYLRLFF